MIYNVSSQHSSHAASTTPCSLIQPHPTDRPFIRPPVPLLLPLLCSGSVSPSVGLSLSSASARRQLPQRNAERRRSVQLPLPPSNMCSGRRDGRGGQAGRRAWHLLCALVRSPHHHGCRVGMKTCRSGLTYAPHAAICCLYFDCLVLDFQNLKQQFIYDPMFQWAAVAEVVRGGSERATRLVAWVE